MITNQFQNRNFTLFTDLMCTAGIFSLNPTCLESVNHIFGTNCRYLFSRYYCTNFECWHISSLKILVEMKWLYILFVALTATFAMGAKNDDESKSISGDMKQSRYNFYIHNFPFSTDFLGSSLIARKLRSLSDCDAKCALKCLFYPKYESGACLPTGVCGCFNKSGVTELIPGLVCNCS